MYQQTTIAQQQPGVRVRWWRVLLAGVAIVIAVVALTGSSGDDSVPAPTPAAAPAPESAAPLRSQAEPPASSASEQRSAARRQTARRQAVAAANRTTATARAAARRRVAARNGSHASLPYTGASSWVAACLGIALLAGGVTIQRRADDVGVFALTHRRGPLLRADFYAAAASGARAQWRMLSYLLRVHGTNLVADWRSGNAPSQ